MSSKSHLPVRVVVFASEQLVPALQFLLHTAHYFGSSLQSIHIYCTKDERRSWGPARRLQAVMKKWGKQNGLIFTVDITTGEMWPAAVREGLVDCFELYSESHWLVNVTGGTKPMSAAATEMTLGTNLLSRRVIYQEINGQWVELVIGDDGYLDVKLLSATSDEIVPAPDTLDRLLAVEDLVGAQFSAQHRITTQSLEIFPIDGATSQVIALGWRWAAGLKSIGVSTTGNGDAFERFIGVGLASSGLSLRHSLKVLDCGAAEQVVREVDLVGCHRGRLVIIDIKLPGTEDHLKGTQLADVAELSHSLGGRAGLSIAVRPGWPEDAGIRRLAEALGVRLLTQAQAARIFSEILSLVDPKLLPSDAVLRAERTLQMQRSQGNAVLSDGRSISNSATKNGNLYMPTIIKDMAERRNQCWALVQFSSTEYYLGVSKASVYGPSSENWPAVINQLNEALDNLAINDGEKKFAFSHSKAWISAQFFSEPGITLDILQYTFRKIFGKEYLSSATL